MSNAQFRLLIVRSDNCFSGNDFVGMLQVVTRFGRLERLKFTMEYVRKRIVHLFDESSCKKQLV